MDYENNYQYFVREIAPALLTELPFMSKKDSYKFHGTVKEVYTELKREASCDWDFAEWDEVVAQCSQHKNDCTLTIAGTAESWGHIDKRWTCCVEYLQGNEWDIEEWEDCS